jgi:transcriptional regulator with XRE-family HTH domain
MGPTFSETTVWKETVAPKANGGFYDFAKLWVRVFGLGQTIKYWRTSAGFSQNMIVDKIGLKSRFQLMDYESGNVGIPLPKLIKWASLCGKYSEFCFMLPSIKFSRNRREITLPIKYSQIDEIVYFLKPENDRVVKVSLGASKKDLSRISKIFNVKINFLKSFRTINSKALVIFFEYFLRL